MANETVRRVVQAPESFANIPPFPPIAARLIELLSDDNTHIKQLVDLLRADPKLCVELLQRANSAAYGFASRIDSVQDALFLLGLDTVKTLTLTLATGQYAKVARQKPELHRCWRHTLATALLAEELTQASSLAGDQAYTAGLLHDIGRLGLLVAHPREYAELLRSADQQGQKDDSTYLLDLERRRFGVDHCEAGCWLAGHWQLPQELSAVAGRHHDRAYGSEIDLLKIVHLSCRFADTLGYDVIQTSRPFTFERLRESLPEGMRERLGPDQDALQHSVAKKIDALDPRPGEDSDHDRAASGGEADEATPEALDLDDLDTVEPDHKTPDTPQVTSATPSFQIELVVAMILGVIVAIAFLLFVEI